MTQRGRYRTQQRSFVESCLAANAGRYLTVDDMCASINAAGGKAGRTTVYRILESMFEEGTALKAVLPGGEARYQMASDDATGQIVCLECGSVTSLDCRMARDLAIHVREHHGFSVEPARTVLYGTCSQCGRAAHGS